MKLFTAFSISDLEIFFKHSKWSSIFVQSFFLQGLHSTFLSITAVFNPIGPVIALIPAPKNEIVGMT